MTTLRRVIAWHSAAKPVPAKCSSRNVLGKPWEVLQWILYGFVDAQARTRTPELPLYSPRGDLHGKEVISIINGAMRLGRSSLTVTNGKP